MTPEEAQAKIAECYLKRDKLRAEIVTLLQCQTHVRISDRARKAWVEMLLLDAIIDQLSDPNH